MNRLWALGLAMLLAVGAGGVANAAPPTAQPSLPFDLPRFSVPELPEYRSISPPATPAASTSWSKPAPPTTTQSRPSIAGAEPPEIRSVTINTTHVAFDQCSGGSGELVLPNGECRTAAFTVTNSGSSGRMVVSATNANHVGGGHAWALVAGSPGADQFHLRTASVSITSQPTCDLAFGPECHADAGESANQILILTGPQSTSAVGTYTVAITWTAQPD